MMECTMGMMGAMWLFWTALFALVGWGLYRLVAARRGTPPPPPPSESPPATLDRRYASGE